jgi:ATP-dependent Clp protease ATP-binding subunit ClpA
MPKINVYLPDDLAAAVREARLSVSPICQQALAEAVRVVGAAREAADVIRDPDFDPRQHPQISARIAALMTPRLRQALGRARDLAGPSGLAGTAHLLVGVIDEPGNLGVEVLSSLGVDVPSLRDAAAQAGHPAEPEGIPPRPPGRREGLLGGLSTNARLAIAGAMGAAIDLGHNFLGCEHLVLALADQADGTAGELLGGLGIKPESIRRAIPPALAAVLGYLQGRQMPAPVIDSRLDEISRRLEDVEERLRAGGL